MALLLNLAAWVGLGVLVCALGTPPESEDGPEPLRNDLEIYTKLFVLKRKEQIHTAEQVWAVHDYAKQYKTVQFLMDTIFPVLKQSLVDIAEMGFKPGDPFPKALERREVLGKIYENVLFFGDVLLRMPDITKKIYRQHQQWKSVLKESIQFCNASTELFNGQNARQLHLMAQESGIIPEDMDYINPFRATKPHPEKGAVPQKGQNKNKKKSGPKLRGSKFSKSEL